MISLIRKSAGVFLWVRLVLRDVLNGLRDGDDLQALDERVQEIPADLDDYFMLMIKSIEPRNRKTASELFQLALNKESEFITLHRNTLLDVSFIEERRSDFVLRPSYDFSKFSYGNTGAMAFRLDSTMRKVNSCCLGLLQWSNHELRWTASLGSETTQDGIYIQSAPMISSRIPNDSSSDRATALVGETNVLTAASLSLDFIHRSFSDFLQRGDVQTLLQQYSQGEYDVRMFLRSARLAQLLALRDVEDASAFEDLDRAIGLASYISSTLSVAGYRNEPGAAVIATIMQPVIEKIAQVGEAQHAEGWYLASVLQNWNYEESTFLTLAIDFNLESYVRGHLTYEAVHTKKGRPMLDYVLRPRFPVDNFKGDMRVGHQFPNPAFLRTIIGFGADPNQKYHGVSVWALFLCLAADHFFPKLGDYDDRTCMEVAYHEAICIMLRNGAHSLLPKSWLLVTHLDLSYGRSRSVECSADDKLDDRVFNHRFPGLAARVRKDSNHHVIFAVSDILEVFRNRFGSSFDTLKSLAQEKEALDLVRVGFQP